MVLRFRSRFLQRNATYSPSISQADLFLTYIREAKKREPGNKVAFRQLPVS